MLRSVLRASAAACGATIVLAALATPAAADGGYVPDGCIGSEVFVCTGDATPFGQQPTVTFIEVPISLSPSPWQVAGISVGGQEVGGVVVLVPGRSIDGIGYTIAPTVPVVGVAMPVGVCAFVACYAAGTPVTTPATPLPVVPVVFPGMTVPSQTLTVPVITAVPTAVTPTVDVPGFDFGDTSVGVYSFRDDEVRDLARTLCSAVGGA